MTYQIISERRLKRKAVIKNPDDIYELVKRYAEEEQEYFILLTLNGSHVVISSSIVTIGLVNKTIVHPREVFCRAIGDMATAIIVCHNHPSGQLYPSGEDIEITDRLMKAAHILGIPLLDHLIINKSGYMSFRKEGLLDNLQECYENA